MIKIPQVIVLLFITLFYQQLYSVGDQIASHQQTAQAIHNLQQLLEEESCAICRTEGRHIPEEERIIVLPHSQDSTTACCCTKPRIYHVDCLDNWFKHSHRCPYCNQLVRKVPLSRQLLEFWRNNNMPSLRELHDGVIFLAILYSWDKTRKIACFLNHDFIHGLSDEKYQQLHNDLDAWWLLVGYNIMFNDWLKHELCNVATDVRNFYYDFGCLITDQASQSYEKLLHKLHPY